MNLRFCCSAALAIAAASPALSQASAPSAQPAAPPPVNLTGVQQIVGNWSYHPLAGGSQAVFIDSSGNVRLIVRCTTSSRLVTLTRTGVSSAASSMAVTTSFGARTLPSRYDAAQNLSADVAANDLLLDQIAFSRGRFAISNSLTPALIIPAWGEVGRVVEDCRG